MSSNRLVNRLLELLERERTEARRVLDEAVQRWQRQKDEASLIEAKIANIDNLESAAMGSAALSDPVSDPVSWSGRAARRRLCGELATIRAGITTAERDEVEPARRVLVDSHVRCKTVEKLAARRREESRLLDRQMEAREIDDVAAHRWLAGREPTPDAEQSNTKGKP